MDKDTSFDNIYPWDGSIHPLDYWAQDDKNNRMGSGISVLPERSMTMHPEISARRLPFT